MSPYIKVTLGIGLNPLTPTSNQNRTSPHNITIKKNFKKGIIS